MSVSYELVRKSGHKSISLRGACYIAFYNDIASCKEVNVYIKVEGNKFSRKEIRRYIILLSRMGFKFSLERKLKQIEFSKREGRDVVKYNVPHYDFHLNFDDNSIVANKVILNAIRYLEEGYLPNIVKKFLSISKRLNRENLWAAFLISHYEVHPGGHSIHPYYKYAKFPDKGELDKDILSNTSNMGVADLIPVTVKAVVNGDIGNILNNINTFTEAKEAYLKLIR